MDSTNTPEPKKVLIVEDDKIQQIILERILNKMGHTVIGSSSEGSKAIESALRIGAVDLILMDINLADDIDGIEAAKEISKHREVKLVYITSSSDPEKYERAKQTKFIDYLMKPLTKEMLEETFLKAFSSHVS
ncbi:MAG TPA: response regulator [Bacteroidales bacterium]|nr:response regulator [Bacteroidales bacterium]